MEQTRAKTTQRRRIASLSACCTNLGLTVRMSTMSCVQLSDRPLSSASTGSSSQELPWYGMFSGIILLERNVVLCFMFHVFKTYVKLCIRPTLVWIFPILLARCLLDILTTKSHCEVVLTVIFSPCVQYRNFHW